MAMTPDDILVRPALDQCVRGQARSLLLLHEASQRLASVFATQQRWLMAHAALAQYFRAGSSNAGTGLLSEHVLDLVERHHLASRNTASAFLKELLKYGTIRHVAETEGERHRPIEPAPATLEALFHWHVVHLATLDGLDGGSRSATLAARPQTLGWIQPLIADGLLSSNAVREPDRTFSLFTWVNEGGIVMDRLIVGCQDEADGLDRVVTDVTSVSSLAQRLRLSRTQLGRKLAAAEAMGSLGWCGTRGKSRLWVSTGFKREYHAAQAAKLAIVDAAFEACFNRAQRAQVIGKAASASASISVAMTTNP